MLEDPKLALNLAVPILAPVAPPKNAPILPKSLKNNNFPLLRRTYPTPITAPSNLKKTAAV